MAKKAYIVLAHTFRPADGENTSMKDFGKKGKWFHLVDPAAQYRTHRRFCGVHAHFDWSRANAFASGFAHGAMFAEKVIKILLCNFEADRVGERL